MATDEPRGPLALRNVSGDLTAVQRPGSALATVGRVAAGMLGISLATLSGLGIIGLILDRAREPPVIVLVAAIGAAGLVITRFAFRSGRPSRQRPVEAALAASPALASAIRQRMLAVASHYGGRLTAAELAASLGIEESPAARVLETAAETGDARMLFSPEGVAVYEFLGLVAHKAEAKEPWDL